MSDVTKGQMLFDFALPRKPTLRPDELATLLDVSERSILRAFDAQELMGLGFNFRGDSGNVSTRRIPRECAILWLATRANYTPEDLEARFAEAFAAQRPELLLRLQAHLSAALARAANR